MGFRCPNCHKDFGTNKDLLLKHLKENGECRAVADLVIYSIDLKSGKKKTKRKQTKRKTKRQFSFIDKNHKFQKISLVSNDDGSDDVKCVNCGLKAKRFMNGVLKFYKRLSYKRIEICKPI